MFERANCLQDLALLAQTWHFLLYLSQASVIMPNHLLVLLKCARSAWICHCDTTSAAAVYVGQAPLKKNAELFFPPEFADDFPVAMQISDKYGLVYVITKLGLLFVYDLETATAVYRNRISPDPIFLTAPAPGIGGFYAINR